MEKNDELRALFAGRKIMVADGNELVLDNGDVVRLEPLGKTRLTVVRAFPNEIEFAEVFEMVGESAAYILNVTGEGGAGMNVAEFDDYSKATWPQDGPDVGKDTETGFTWTVERAAEGEGQ